MSGNINHPTPHHLVPSGRPPLGLRYRTPHHKRAAVQGAVACFVVDADGINERSLELAILRKGSRDLEKVFFFSDV